MRRWILGMLMALGAACEGSDGAAQHEQDAGSCRLKLALGADTDSAFAAIDDGEQVELVLGFQGIRMLLFDLRVEGTDASSVDVVTHLGIEATGQAIDQRDRDMALTETDGVSLVDGYIFFVNDVAASTALGSTARIELIARTDTCEGTLVQQVELRDDDHCVDFDIVVDASLAVDVPDGSVACGEGP